jgi:hypothetical protein
MPPHPCPNFAEVVAVQLLNLVGAKKMTRTNVPILAESARGILNPFVGRYESQKVFKYILIIFEFDEVNTILM